MSRYRFTLILVSFAALCGCRSLPDVNLGNCEDVDCDVFVRHFQFDISGPLQYRYTLRWRSTVLVANGITHKTGEGIVNTAGFSSIGTTLYSASWRDGHLEILKNNTRLSDKFLSRRLLSDVLLLYRQLPAEGDCIRQNVLDGSLWLETDLELAGGTGYFVVLDEQPAWGAIRNKKIWFKAVVTQKNNNAPARIAIENFGEGYNAEIRFFNRDSEKKEGI